MNEEDKFDEFEWADLENDAKAEAAWDRFCEEHGRYPRGKELI